MGAEVPGPGGDQPHHGDRVSGGRWNPGTNGSRGSRARYGLALAGGYAVAAHGMGNRPSDDVDLFTSDALGALTQITDAAFAEYRADPDMIADMRHRFAQWRRELLAADPG
jgi:hypothetical protein